MKINTGFLTGNLLANTEGVNEPATAKRFAETLASAISDKYPYAEVEIDWREGSGHLPQKLWTAVDYDPGHGEVDNVNCIVGEVIKSGAFHIYETGDAGTDGAGVVKAGPRLNLQASPAPLSDHASVPRFLRAEKGVVETFRKWMREKAGNS